MKTLCEKFLFDLITKNKQKFVINHNIDPNLCFLTQEDVNVLYLSDQLRIPTKDDKKYSIMGMEIITVHDIKLCGLGYRDPFQHA